MSIVRVLVRQSGKFWGRVTLPRGITSNDPIFHQFTLLNSVLVSLLIVEILLLPLLPVMVPRRPTISIQIIVLIAFCVTTVLYFISRQGHYTIASVATVSLVTVAVCGATLAINAEMPLKFLSLSSVIGVILLSRTGAWRVLLFNLAAGVVTAYTLPGSVFALISDDLLLVFFLSLGLLLTATTTDHYLKQIKAQHEALLDSQKRELNWVAENERARVMREWVAYMSHDFRTPLAVMSTTLYVMERNHKPELNPQRIQTLNTQVERLTSLVNHVHAAASLDQEVKPHLVTQDILPLIQEVVDRLTPLADKQKVGIQLNADPALPHLPVDADGFRLALECLLENAIMYNKATGLVTVRSMVDATHLRLTVEDTGVGIAPHDLPFIFDRFYRVDKARQIEQGRNGLGLSIAKMVAEAHQGKIEVKSVLGVGSTFTLLFPLSETYESHENVFSNRVTNRGATPQ